MMRISKHFDESEFRCHHCQQLPDGGMDTHLLDVLEEMRKDLGVPLQINSGYRCPEHNAAVGGVPDSQHVQGVAADVQVPPGLTVKEVAAAAERAGADGIGYYYDDNFVHVDTRGYAARWEG